MSSKASARGFGRRGLLSSSIFTGVLLTTAILPGVAIAQDAAEESDEVVVTAQRREQLLSRVPISVQAVATEQLQTAGVTSPLDLPSVVPGLTTSPGATAGAFFTPFIRGVGANSTAIGNDPSVALFIDGIYQSDKAANVFAFNDIERIEVLRGPQGTLFGRNATGGAVNIVTRRPSFTPEVSAEAGVGSYDERTFRAYATGPIGDVLAGSLSISTHDGFDYFDVIGTGEETGGVDSTSITGRLLFRPNERFEALLGVMYDESSTGVLRGSMNMVAPPIPVGVFYGGQAAPEPYTMTAAQRINRIENTGTRASLHMRYSFDNFDLVSITGATNVEPLTILDYDATTTNLFFFHNPGETRDISQEIQLLSTTEGPFEWVLGAFYLRNEPEAKPLTFGVGVPYPATDAQVLATPGGSRIRTFARGPIEAMAIYAQGTWALSDATNVTAGARYTSETRNYEFEQYGIGDLAPGFSLPVETLIGQDDQSEDFGEPSFRLSVDHTFRDGFMGYLSYNRGFKSGTYNLNDFCAGQTPVDSEILDSYEAGIKSRWFGNALQVDGAAFYYDYRNIQVTRINPSSCASTTLQNAGGAEMFGLDLDLALRATDNLRFTANISLLSAEYTDFTGASGFEPGVVGGTAIVIDATGTNVIFAPEFAMTLGADYRIPLSNGSSLDFNGNYFYTSDYKTVVGEGNFVDSYGLLSASAQWNSPAERYYIRLWGRNLTDEVSIGRNLNAFGSQHIYVDPRSYGVAVGFNFN